MCYLHSQYRHGWRSPSLPVAGNTQRFGRNEPYRWEDWILPAYGFSKYDERAANLYGFCAESCPPFSLCHTYTHTHTHTLALSLSLSHTHTLTHSYIHTLTHTLKNTQTQIICSLINLYQDRLEYSLHRFNYYISVSMCDSIHTVRICLSTNAIVFFIRISVSQSVSQSVS